MSKVMEMPGAGVGFGELCLEVMLSMLGSPMTQFQEAWAEGR